MRKEELQVSLVELHNQLSQLDNVDPTTRHMLETVMNDIGRVLQAAEEPTAEPADESTDRSDSLRNMVAEFEAEHPQLARTIAQIADGLASIGI